MEHAEGSGQGRLGVLAWQPQQVGPVEALAFRVEAVDVVDDIPLEVEHLERFTVERAPQREELLHEPDDLAALGLHAHLT